MSESYIPAPASGFTPSQSDDQGKMDAAKQEAGELKDTATAQASQVASTAKAEAANVAREAKSQVKDLFAQTQSEMKDQAGVQQQRVASGLRSLSDELSSMASNSESSGLASDLVRQVSDRAGSAASWLDSRDPGSLLNEVKSYARRSPGTFVAFAAIAGVAAGRLTKALAGNAADEKEAPETPVASAAPVGVADAAISSSEGTVVDTPVYTEGLVDETPLYTQKASTLGDGYQPNPEEGYQR